MTDKFKKITVENFSNNCKNYDNYATTQKIIAQKLAQILPNNDNLNILEIGCGTGILTEILAKKYPNSNIFATDISNQMINIAKGKSFNNSSIKYSIFDGDVDEIEKFNTNFDFCVSSMSIQWIENLNQLIGNIAQNCDFYFSTIGENNFYEWKNCLNQFGHKINQKKHNINFKYFKQITITEQFEKPNDFVKQIIKTGAGNDFNNKKISYTVMKNALSLFNQKYDNTITWDILFYKIDKKINQ